MLHSKPSTYNSIQSCVHTLYVGKTLCADAAAQQQVLSSARQQQAGAVGMLHFKASF